MARNSKFTRKSPKLHPTVVYGGKFKRSPKKTKLKKKIFGGLILLAVLSVVLVLVVLKMNEIEVQDQSQQPEECQCNPDGSITLKCNSNGGYDCTCKDGFISNKCNGSEPNILGDNWQLRWMSTKLLQLSSIMSRSASTILRIKKFWCRKKVAFILFSFI